MTETSIQDLVVEDMIARRNFGEKKYGTRLFPNNGRNMDQDAYEEALDLACYLKGMIVEREQRANLFPKAPRSSSKVRKRILGIPVPYWISNALERHTERLS